MFIFISIILLFFIRYQIGIIDTNNSKNDILLIVGLLILQLIINIVKHLKKKTIKLIPKDFKYNINQQTLKVKIIDIMNKIEIISRNISLLEDNIDTENIKLKQRTILDYLNNYFSEYCDLYLDFIIQDNSKRVLKKNSIRNLNITLYINSLKNILITEYENIIKVNSKEYNIQLPDNINQKINRLKIELTELQTNDLLDNILPIKNYIEVQNMKNKTEMKMYKDKIEELNLKYNNIIDELKSLDELE